MVTFRVQRLQPTPPTPVYQGTFRIDQVGISTHWEGSWIHGPNRFTCEFDYDPVTHLAQADCNAWFVGLVIARFLFELKEITPIPPTHYESHVAPMLTEYWTNEIFITG